MNLFLCLSHISLGLFSQKKVWSKAGGSEKKIKRGGWSHRGVAHPIEVGRVQTFSTL